MVFILNFWDICLVLVKYYRKGFWVRQRADFTTLRTYLTYPWQKHEEKLRKSARIVDVLGAIVRSKMLELQPFRRWKSGKQSAGNWFIFSLLIKSWSETCISTGRRGPARVPSHQALPIGHFQTYSGFQTLTLRSLLPVASCLEGFHRHLKLGRSTLRSTKEPSTG